jgi:octaprenyl-diphosphate synthase
MLRPTLLLLAAKAVTPDREPTADQVTLAAVVEMVHMSTLVHDDVLDEAELRRKGATINHLRGNEAAVLLGDYLISHSYHLCSSVDAPPGLEPQWPARVIGRTTNRLCEGELLQVGNRGNLSLDEETYYEIIRRKTGALTAASCLLGARFAGADSELGQALYRYGELIGMAFQVQDDVLDLAGDVREVGKTLGIDAEKQKLTLPLIHFLRHAPAEHRELLRGLLAGRDPDRAEQVRQLVRPSGSLRHAQREARRLTTEAAACLEDLPAGPGRDSLALICDYVVARSR